MLPGLCDKNSIVSSISTSLKHALFFCCAQYAVLSLEHLALCYRRSLSSNVTSLNHSPRYRGTVHGIRPELTLSFSVLWHPVSQGDSLVPFFGHVCHVLSLYLSLRREGWCDTVGWALAIRLFFRCWIMLYDVYLVIRSDFQQHWRQFANRIRKETQKIQETEQPHDL